MKPEIAIFGKGQIGTLIRNRIGGLFYSTPADLHGVDVAVWAATRGWPHGGTIERDMEMLGENADFVSFLASCRAASICRIIYCSTYAVDFDKHGVTPDYYGNVDPMLNFYTQGKVAGEALLAAYAKAVDGSSCTALRIGWYAPGANTARQDLLRIKMSDDNIIHWVSAALSASTGFHVQQLPRVMK